MVKWFELVDVKQEDTWVQFQLRPNVFFLLGYKEVGIKMDPGKTNYVLLHLHLDEKEFLAIPSSGQLV